MTAAEVILATASPTRIALLRAAGVPAEAEAAAVDEPALRESLHAAGASTEEAATALAEAKARRVSRRHPGALVIGADQMLDCDGQWFEKPADMPGARAQLQALRGRRHSLVSAALAMRDGVRLWHHVAAARLTMRPFTDAFLDRYLAEVADEVTGTVGGYRLEGPGIQLFSRIEGDFFVILGLPLLPLLDFLRIQGVLPE